MLQQGLGDDSKDSGREEEEANTKSRQKYHSS